MDICWMFKNCSIPFHLLCFLTTNNQLPSQVFMRHLRELVCNSVSFRKFCFFLIRTEKHQKNIAQKMGGNSQIPK